MAEKEKASQVAVRATGDNGKVVLWERHPDHPKATKTAKIGEAFISNDGKTRIVAETSEVKRLIGLGLLERAKAGDTQTKASDGKSGEQTKKE